MDRAGQSRWQSPAGQCQGGAKPPKPLHCLPWLTTNMQQRTQLASLTDSLYTLRLSLPWPPTSPPVACPHRCCRACMTTAPSLTRWTWLGPCFASSPASCCAASPPRRSTREPEGQAVRGALLGGMHQLWAALLAAPGGQLAGAQGTGRSGGQRDSAALNCTKCNCALGACIVPQLPCPSLFGCWPCRHYDREKAAA